MAWFLENSWLCISTISFAMHSSMATCGLCSGIGKISPRRHKVQGSTLPGSLQPFFAAFACRGFGRHFSLITAVKLVPALVSLGSTLPPSSPMPPCVGNTSYPVFHRQGSSVKSNSKQNFWFFQNVIVGQLGSCPCHPRLLHQRLLHRGAHLGARALWSSDGGRTKVRGCSFTPSNEPTLFLTFQKWQFIMAVSWNVILQHVADTICLKIYLMQKTCFDIWFGLTNRHFQHQQYGNAPMSELLQYIAQL